jgi:hypothetical protein
MIVWAFWHTHHAQSFVHIIDGVLLPAGALPGLRGTELLGGDATASSTQGACYVSLWLTWSFIGFMIIGLHF